MTTGESVTNALSQITSETLDPTRGLVLTSTDPNGIVTTKQYDALGRVTSEWLDSRYTATSPPAANYLYSYTESNTGLSGNTVEKMNDELGYTETVTILDSLGRTRQTQANTPDGGMLVTDTFYDSRGWVRKKYNAWWDSSATPSLTLVTTQDSQIPNEDVYTYDGLGRTVEDVSEEYAEAVSTTYTVYNGDATTVIPPTGGVTKTTETDARGRTSAVLEYSADPTLTVPSNTNTGLFYITGGTALTTSYGYDGHGDQATTTDADGQIWTSVYNLLGEVTEKIDPTAGDSYMTYDDDGNLTQSEDSRGDYISYVYDALDRKTAEYAAQNVAADQTAGPTGTETAAWVYDNSNDAVTSMTDPIGHLTTEISYSGGNTYTTQYKGFNVFGESTEETVTIPTAVTGVAGSYAVAHTYSTATGLLLKDVYYAAGGLAEESVSHTYTGLFDLPMGIGSTYGYTQSVSYDAYGRPTQEELGTATYGEAWITNTYDVHTGKLTDQLVTRGTTTPADVDETAYTYDLSGNITKQVETRLGSSSDTETQCFLYNALDELTTAWSATDACATTPSASSFAMVANTLGTSSAYWTSWTYNSEGDRLTQDQHSLTSSADDKITTYTYSASQPHTLTSTATTVDGAQTATTSYGYDTAGDTTTRTTAATGTQTLTWNNAGELTQVASTTEGTSSYVYDADGNLLVEIDPTATIVYLENQQITYTDSTKALSGIRYYQLPGGGTAVRTSTTTGYQFEITDQHGTADLYLDYTAQNPTWRQFDPYGNARGTAVTWVDNRTFLNKVTDATTGLTDVGARWYDPTLGRFISLDPVFEADDNLALGGYGYTDANPISGEDPTGETNWLWGAITGTLGAMLMPISAPDSFISLSPELADPYDLAVGWILGDGTTRPVVNYNGSAGITGEVETDPHNEALTSWLADKGSGIAGEVGKGWNPDGSDTNYYDKGLHGLIQDGLGALTNGIIGSRPIDSFLGSYDEQYRVMSFNAATDVATVNFYVHNVSDWQSFMHIFDNSPSWNTTGGLGATITENFAWTEQIKVASSSGNSSHYSGASYGYGQGLSGGESEGNGTYQGSPGGTNGDGVYQTGTRSTNSGVYNYNPTNPVVSC